MSNLGQKAQLVGQSSEDDYEYMYGSHEGTTNPPHVFLIQDNHMTDIESQEYKKESKENDQLNQENSIKEGSQGNNHTSLSQSEQKGAFEGMKNLPNTSPIKNNQMNIEHQGNKIQSLENIQPGQGNLYKSHTSSSQSQSQSSNMVNIYLTTHIDNNQNNLNQNLDTKNNNTFNQLNQANITSLANNIQETSIKEGSHGYNHISPSQSEQKDVFEGMKNLPNASPIKNNQMNVEHQGNNIQSLQNIQPDQGNLFKSPNNPSQSQSQSGNFENSEDKVNIYLNTHIDNDQNNLNQNLDTKNYNNTFNQLNQANFISLPINSSLSQKNDTKSNNFEVQSITFQKKEIFQIVQEYDQNKSISGSQSKNNEPIHHLEEEYKKQQNKEICQLISPTDQQQNNQSNVKDQNTNLKQPNDYSYKVFSSDTYSNIINSKNTDQYLHNQTSQSPSIEEANQILEKEQNKNFMYQQIIAYPFQFNNNKHQGSKELYLKNNKIQDLSLLRNVNLTIRIDDLITNYPLRQFSIPIKQDIYNQLISSLSQQNREQELHITRCTKNTKLPEDINCYLLKTEQIQCEDTFSYFKPDINENHWYLNFADSNLFGFYTSALYAQDELQCTEMPMLAHIKEYLEQQTEQPRLKPRTQSNDQPTPILIQNVPRIGTININPCTKYRRGLYGNNFRELQRGDLNEKLTVFKGENLVYTNIIAMSAIGYGHGIYKEQQIIFTLLTAYKAFEQAVISTQEYAKGKKCVIHTGNWGCGAFGNNYQLMAILQLLAANLAGVDILYYHTFNQHGTTQYKIGKSTYERIVNASQTQSDGGAVKLSHIINLILQEKFKWGQSDGN